MCTNQSYIFEIIWQLNPHDATMIFCPIAGFCFSSLINPNDTFQRGSVFLSYLASKLCKKNMDRLPSGRMEKVLPYPPEILSLNPNNATTICGWEPVSHNNSR